ncbi:autotransporter outer membrane beta-barrel domain-containing protein [Xenorhabdus griffiniae]|uniref:SGNH/GDSL hydrolase family protein n=1 Tax=Xenorhabdus griffiniae TaxID=351672 RepID=A0ABY9XCZ9_9GAMM|nr:autotransporter domain-containing protein [Xenorhabdus griffiniae]MBD1228102.1 autotransporter domain-containing protein [Xenorhabdus griffiniae]MBE8587250.1 autotransporter domain-containing protein [Xenorhabdus griffiniae]WMV70793.1 SGNH/GDSL hydrolase family protein [Xenorhabdus griffiniae]WNH00469.1 SGNH/GDSL hydrolase family protein [Xenorhabdus griffiniae]
MKKAFLFTPALLALSINAVSTAHAYDRVYVFGDSLSDSGNNGRYTTDGATSQLYVEYFTQHITGTTLIPSRENGGTNYAQGGAMAINYKFNTQEQVNRYLNSQDGKADPNSIYIHWVGGNDIAQALEDAAKEKDPQERQKVAAGVVVSSATATANQINQLIKQGAGLVIVPTVPDVSTTPRFLETVLTQVLTPADYKELSEKQKEAINQTIHGGLKSVHDGINTFTTPNKEYRRLILEGTLKKIIEILSPNEVEAKYEKLLAAYNQASAEASKLTDTYNEQVSKLIDTKNGNILRADINGLLNEVIANPTVYGIQNTLGYACPYGVKINECSANMSGFAEYQSLFSDSFHPTPLGQKIMGQYITSIYIAPSQVMTLTQVNRASVKSALSSLDGHLQQLRNGGNEQGKVGVFGGYTGNQDKTFTLGSDYQLLDNLLLGAMYSNYKEERSPIADFSYAGRGHVLTAYTLWNYYNNGWLSGDFHYSRTNYESLTRTIQLGEATRREIGSTTGKQWGARITAGWDIPVTHYLTTSPIIQYAWDKGDIDGYRESGNNSTSMHFGDQDYTSKVGTLGWRVDTQLGRFNPYASVQFNHQFGDTSNKLRSFMNTDSSHASAVMKSDKQSTNWRQYTVGVNANLINNLRGFASVTRNDGNSQDPSYNFSLGINASF